MPTDRQRHDLFVALRASLGDGPADSMMDLLPPVGWADVARRSDVERAESLLRADVERLDAKIDAVESRLETKIDALRAQVIYANIASMLGVAGLVLAATRLG